MRKRIFSILLALCMVLCLVLTAAFAEGKAEETPVCTCETACTAEAVNADWSHLRRRGCIGRKLREICRRRKRTGRCVR